MYKYLYGTAFIFSIRSLKINAEKLKRIRQCEVCQKEWIVFGGNMIYEENAMGAFKDINIAVEHFSRVVPYGGNYKYKKLINMQSFLRWQRF